MIKESVIFHKRPAPVAGQIVPTPIGSMNYNVLRALIEEGLVLKLNKGAEIGIFEGTTSQHLLKSFPTLTLYCVDPFIDYSELESNRTQEKMNLHEQEALKKLSVFGNRAKIIKDFSVQASKQIADESLDFIFIDALHTYEAVPKI